MPFVGCCALVYFWTLRFSRIGDFYTLRLGFFGNLDLRIIEDLDFDTKEQLGNFPQAYSHLALVNTAILFAEEDKKLSFIRP